jgi:transketolase
MRKTFINTLLKEARKDERIFLITPDLGYSILEPFQQEFPDRFLNVGIAEQNAISVAAGLALNGKIPYVYSIIPFITSRCHEQVKLDCAYMNTNVRIVGVGAGYSYGAAGATHHSIEDIAIMRALPNMAIVAPGCPNEVEALVKYSTNHSGPMYIRLSKSGEPQINKSKIEFSKISTLNDGKDFVIIATSNMLEEANNLLLEYKIEGKNPMLLSAHTLKPFDNSQIIKLIDSGMSIITMAEHSIIGGLASIVSEIIAQSGKGVRFLPIAIPDEFSHYVGGQKFIKEKMGLSNLKEKINKFLDESICQKIY